MFPSKWFIPIDSLYSNSVFDYRNTTFYPLLNSTKATVHISHNKPDIYNNTAINLSHCVSPLVPQLFTRISTQIAFAIELTNSSNRKSQMANKRFFVSSGFQLQNDRKIAGVIQLKSSIPVCVHLWCPTDGLNEKKFQAEKFFPAVDYLRIRGWRQSGLFIFHRWGWSG